MESPDAAQAAGSRTLWIAGIVACVLVAITALQWSIVNALTPFLALPVQATAWLLFIATGIWCAIYAIRNRRAVRRAYAPIAVCLFALLLVWLVPFTKFWLDANFYFKRGERERVVADVLSGRLKPNVAHNLSLVALPKGAGLSAGGDEIVVRAIGNATYILFFTFRGILNNASGFLWVSDGGKPEHFAAAEGGAEVVRYADHWFFVSFHQ